MAYPFEIHPINGHLTRIVCAGKVRAFLLTGTERAALIDTGTGLGSLRAVVRQLTDKPITVLLSHGHLDHAQGAPEFDDVWLHPADVPLYEALSKPEVREKAVRGFVKPILFDTFAAEMIPWRPIALHPLLPGAVFDLGSLHVETLAAPGHTEGSVVFLLPELRTIMLGDACNDSTLLFESSVADYRRMLVRLHIATAGRYDRVLLMHNDNPYGPELMDQMIDLCTEILAGNTARLPFVFAGQPLLLAKAIGPDKRPADGSAVNLAYRSGADG